MEDITEPKDSLEGQRLANIAERDELLKNLGFNVEKVKKANSAKTSTPTKQVKRQRIIGCNSATTTRRSERTSGKKVVNYSEKIDYDFSPRKTRRQTSGVDGTFRRANNLHRVGPDSVQKVMYVPKGRPNVYGEIEGCPVGTTWDMRWDCSYAGVHRPTVAGIQGGDDGCCSICLSGGYPEDVDEGFRFTYTGSGGRDLKGTASNPKNLRTAPQSKDQQLEGNNKNLTFNILTKQPVRVVRGYKLPSQYAPTTGYRYDGLYNVTRYWADVGATGFRVYRYEFERVEGQGPAPWEAGFIQPPPWEREIHSQNKGETDDDDCRAKKNATNSDDDDKENSDEEKTPEETFVVTGTRKRARPTDSDG